MSREKYNLQIVVDIDMNTTFGDIRRFVELLKGMPDDMPVVTYPNLNEDQVVLFGYIDQTQEQEEHPNG